MATPINFNGTNVRMNPPPGSENIEPVMAFRNEQHCVTCWQLTPPEIAEVVETGCIFLTIQFGGGMPPAYVGGEDSTREITADYGGTFPRQR